MCFVLAVVFGCVSVSKRFQCGFNVIFSGFKAGPAKEPSVASAERRHIGIISAAVVIVVEPCVSFWRSFFVVFRFHSGFSAVSMSSFPVSVPGLQRSPRSHPLKGVASGFSSLACLTKLQFL